MNELNNSQQGGHDGAVPNGGFDSAVPNDGFDSVVSNGGFDGAVPNDGFDGAMPNGDFDGAVPNDGFDGAVPNDGFDSAVPNDGFDGAAPGGGYNGSVDGAVPNDGFDSAVPNDGFDSVVSTGGFDGAVPKDGHDGAVPSGGYDGSFDGAVPNDGFDSAAPGGGFDSAMPNDGFDSAVPNGGFDSAVPNDGFDSAVPNDGFNSAVPGYGGGFERTMPFSREAEQSVLGAMLLDMQCIPDAINIVKSDDFYIERHRELFDTITELYSLGKPIDIVTLKEQLTLRGSFESVGGLPFIMETMNLVPTTRNIVHYAKIVAEKSVLRRLIRVSQDIEERCFRGNEELESIVATAEQAIIDLSQDRNTTGPVHISRLLDQSVETLTKLTEANDTVTGIPTGFIDIDRRTAGLHGSELILIAARPGMGKTSFALNIAQNAAVHSGTTVAVFNLEMPGVQLANRMLSSEAMISSESLKKGDIKDEDWDRIGEAFEVLSKANIYIDDTSTITVSEIVARCRKLKIEHNLGMVVIDYIQLMSSGRRDGNRQMEITEISRALKVMAKDLNIPVIALSQLNRAVEKRDSKEPVLSDLRESGSIEQDADMVMLLYREGYYNPEAEEPNRAKCIFAKHRNGETGAEYLTWLGEFTKFSNWSGNREH